MKKTKKEADKFSTGTVPATAIRILLADDKKSIREVISEFLEFIGYEVALNVINFSRLFPLLRGLGGLMPVVKHPPVPLQKGEPAS